MTIIYCDLCGRPLPKGKAPNQVFIRVCEFSADSCDDCAKKLIAFVKSGPWKGGAK